jgi:ABC-2 type transport system ATP-binding protein
MNSAIDTHQLIKSFGRTEALRSVDLQVPEGAIYALVGANGAGKTTLIKLLMNIRRPTAGISRMLGINSAQITGSAFGHIGYVSENQDLPGGMTVREFLEYMRPFYPQWDRELEAQLVRQFDLPLDRKLNHLSRGMRMKAAFASSLAYRPQLIVLDEPFSGLDPLVRDELIDSLLDRATETTIFLSSHDLAEIESFASHVGYLEEGRLLFSEEMATLSARFREVTVTLPASASLPAHLPTEWLMPEAVDSVVRFVHCGYREPESMSELGATFPSARDITCEAMPLRAIFLAMARSGRTRNHAGAKPSAAERSATT